MKERNSTKTVLVFDIGTQSTRAMVIDSSGLVLSKAKLEHDPAYYRIGIDWAEQEADFYYEMICKAAKRCKTENPKAWEKIEAVSITTIRDTCVCVDEDGKPLRTAILWLDKRKASEGPRLDLQRKALFKMSGMEETVSVQYAKSHCNWIMENQPDIWKKTHKFLMLSGYMIYKMTGRFVDVDASLVGHIPFNFKERRWQSPKELTWPVFPIEKEKLCLVVPTGTVLGHVTKQMSADSGLNEGLPVIGTGADKACEILGLGCVKEDEAALGLGTAATISLMTSQYVGPERFIPPYAAVIPGRYNPECEIYRGYWLISWFKKEFAALETAQAEKEGISVEALLNRQLAQVPAGCDGLILQPYFTPNITMPTAKGAIVGFSDVHTRMHLYRAIIEGVNFALMDGLNLIEKRANKKIKRILIGGGGSQSDEICQITADMFGMPVIRRKEYECTAIGSAISMFVALGVYKSFEEAVEQMVHDDRTFQPNAVRQAVYEELYDQVYKDLYGRLKPVYRKLHGIYHKEK